MNDLEDFYQRMADKAMVQFRKEVIARDELNRKIDRQANTGIRQYDIRPQQHTYVSSPERIAYKKAYYQKNREKLCAWQRESYWRDAEESRNYARTYYAANREYLCEQRKNRRHKRKHENQVLHS